METVLVVAERTRGDEIKKLLYPGGYAFIRAESEREARMKILDYQLSLVIVDAMLPGSSAKDISIFAASQEVDTILLLPEELFGHVAGIMMKYGVYTALFSRDSIMAVSSAISVAREKIRSAEEKNRKLLMRLRNEKLLTELMGKLDEYPKRLSLEEQGKFILGYYHQVQKKYEKKEEK